MPEAEWQRALLYGEEYLAKHGHFARDGAPRLVHQPATARARGAGHSDACQPKDVARKYIVKTGTKRFEAHGLPELRELIASGAVNDDHQLLHPDSKQWIRVGELSELR